MSKFTIVSSVYNEYELFRQFIESIIHNVDPESYEKVIVVDDFSRHDTKLREYENYINANYPKFHIINFDEYRPARYYFTGDFSSDNFDTTKTSLGVVCSYQMALEHVTTDYVILCDTDIVFLKKSKTLLSTLETLFDEHPDTMGISQLQGWSSDEIFESNLVGSKRIPIDAGGVGGLSPMFSAFRIAAWTEHKLVPIASAPHQKRASGFIDFFLSVIGHGFKVMNFPIYSEDYVFHLGGGTARRVNKETEIGFGHAKGCTYRYAACADGTVYDYYAGAHKINMDAKELVRFLQKKYDVPADQLAEPFDESILIKYKLNDNRELEFRPVHPEVKGRLRDLMAKTGRMIYPQIWETYTYGKPSTIDWPEFVTVGVEGYNK
jgi:glycosyltransferase involved in cell wall biosynthesis